LYIIATHIKLIKHNLYILEKLVFDLKIRI
ncbi:MAG: hypothetical protein Q606_CBAC00180G0007, partial [Intestinibacter bartlettii DORA_8_9]